MPWVLVDVLIGALALLVLIAALVIGFLHVKALLRTGKSASARVGAAMPPALEPRR
ncbi:MAG: hypothetical protein JWN31_1105 [Frankiales bacterium]|nr:hypothetical protein [Frankiales bacterium]